MNDALIFFKALSDPTRLRIIRLLLDRELCVCELVFILKMSQSRVSHQLRILRDAGLVEDTRDRRWMIYRIPGNIRYTLGPVLGLFENDQTSGPRVLDVKNLQLCLKEDVRRTRPGSPRARAMRRTRREKPI